MTDDRLITSGTVPSGANIEDFAVADVKGRPLVVCADSSHEVWTWDVLGGEWVHRPLADFDNGSYGIPVYPDFHRVAADVVRGQVLFAAGGEHQGPGLWDLMSGDLLSAPPEFRTCVRALDMTTEGGRTVLVAGAAIPEVYLWDPADPEVEPWGPTGDEDAEEQEPRELPGHADDMCGLVLGRLGRRPVVVSGGGDTVSVSDLGSGDPVHAWTAGGRVHAVALSELGGRPVVLAAADPGELRVWDASDGRPVGVLSTGDEARVTTLDAGVVGGRALAVTGGDGTARVWDLASGRQVGAPLAGGGGDIRTVAMAVVNGRDVVLTAGRGGTVGVWDPSAG